MITLGLWDYRYVGYRTARPSFSLFCHDLSLLCNKKTMDLYLYLDILRRRWPLVVGLPLLVALISLGVALMRPPSYRVIATVIATRGITDPTSIAGMTSAREDTVAYDLPAIIGSRAFARDVAQALTQQGRQINEDTVASALHGESAPPKVFIQVTTAQPDDAVIIAQTSIDVLRKNGLRYWGDPTWTPEFPGVDVGTLDLPTSAAPVSTRRSTITEVGIRTLAGVIAAFGLAFIWYYLEEARRIQRGSGGFSQRRTSDDPKPTMVE